MEFGLFSVSYAGLWGQAKLDLFSFLNKASELGYKGVLLMAKRPHLSPLDINEKMLKELKEKLKENNLKLIGLAAYNDFLIPAAAGIPMNEIQIAYVEECARITNFLGGELVRVFTGYENSNVPFFKQWQTTISILRECADRAAKYNITLAVQNHHDMAIDTRSLDLLFTEIDRPNIRAGYDAWSPYLRNEDLYKGAKKMAPKTSLSIVGDYIKLARYKYQKGFSNYARAEPDFMRAIYPGKGDVDYRLFFSGLKDGGYNGWIVYEMCSPIIGGPSLENLDKYAKGFLEFMDSGVV